MDNLTDVKNNQIAMVEIFQSIEGEGTKAGTPTTFIRLFGCNLRCSWCDTKYSYEPDKPRFYASVEQILEQATTYGSSSVCLTGGEPLLSFKNAYALLLGLGELDFIKDIHIETNGSIDLTPYCKLRNDNANLNQKVRFVVDYKPISSGQNEKMNLNNFSLLSNRDEIKFVIGSEEDFLLARTVIEQYYQSGQILFSPLWGKIEPARLVSLMLDSKLLHARLSLQLHKMIWGQDKEGV
ncbi:7-carboxy-7-deazaguanine synthase QueE [Anaeromicropila populeti]|uniref:7-carboxy-7-deazaguanine synthase n=1 Tax=Anaeromicropila populeti TaxID=37658 RepID=A0A1I6I5Y9_9FIRM|nr:radical SAM protein [Anaeromicropila populeti]SFR62157.1 7-carboxy-7-deazaguanine synthase [Anaeromicropila populeti]